MRLAILLLAVFTAWCARAADAPELSWYQPQGELVWRAPVTSAEGRPTTPLTVGRWFPSLPQLEFPLIEEGTAPTAAYAGQVLLLDFWASWCDPCVETLPWLQALHESKTARGLEVLTVNMQESDDVARQFAWALNLKMPIARYTPALHDVLQVESLPTMIVVDRRGRVRKRVNGYRKGVEEEIADLVDILLAEDAGERQSIAEIEAGGGTLQVRWSRRVPERVLGLTVVPDEDGGAQAVLAATGWDVFGFDTAGDALMRRLVGPGVDRLRIVGRTAGGFEVFGFRPVGTRLVRVPLDDDAEVVKLEASSNVLDLTAQASRNEMQDSLLLATLKGLERVGLAGETLDRRSDTGPVWQLGAATEADQTLALLDEGKLLWVDRDLVTLREIAVPASSRVLVASRTGFGVSSPAVTAAAVGSFVESGAVQVAVATEGRLVVLDADSGLERFTAQWPKIAALATADLDGDDLDELIVGSGKRVTVLESGSLLDEVPR